MAASDRPESSASESRSLRSRRRFDDVVVLVAAVALLAIIARLVFLGERIAHWDEARVAYWIVHYQETGHFAYRRIIHGPFVQHVNRWLFPVVGANDFTMRLPVALVGGLLPLSAILFRKHLRRVEVVAMALFLSFNPVLLYYSRFMRSDLLVATFMFVAFGLFVRFYDERKLRYVAGAAAFAALGFASKENAAIYVMTWVGALGLLADAALFRPRTYRSGYALLADKARTLYRTRLAGWLAAGGLLASATRARIGSPSATEHDAGADGDEAPNGGRPPAARSRDELVAAVVTVLSPVRYAAYVVVPALVFAGLLLFLYAQRGAGMEGIRYPPAAASAGAVGFWEALGSPSAFVQMVETTWTYASEEFGAWFGRATEAGDRGLVEVYLEYLGGYVRVMGTKAAPLTAFAVFGFLLERYGAARSRNLVMFAAYCGFVSVVGYPLGTDIFGAWLVVHALVPLSIPAAVGLARIYDWGHEAFVDDDAVGVGIAAVLLVLVAAQVGAVAATSVYSNHQSDDNHLVQYAQPGGDPRAELQTMGALGQDDDPDVDVVLYYGEQGQDYDDNYAFIEDTERTPRLNLQPACANWYNSLPLPWYFAKDDVDVECERSQENMSQRVATNAPPMVVTQERDRTVPADVLEAEYEGTTYEMRTYGTETTFWVRQDVADERA